MAYYDVTVRTRQGYLAYEYRLSVDALETDALYLSNVADPRYVVTLKFVGGLSQ